MAATGRRRGVGAAPTMLGEVRLSTRKPTLVSYGPPLRRGMWIPAFAGMTDERRE